MEQLLNRLTYMMIGARDAADNLAKWTTSSGESESDNAYANGCLDTLDQLLVWLEAEKKALQD